MNPLNSNDDIVKSALISSVDDLLARIRPLLIDFILEIYSLKHFKSDYFSIDIISTLYNIPISTLNKWIAAGLLSKLEINGALVISTLELKNALESIYVRSRGIAESNSNPALSPELIPLLDHINSDDNNK